MTQTIPAITKLMLSGQINPAILSPLSEAILVNTQFNFQNITVLNVVTGTYTPANDTKTIYTFGGTEEPNFLLVFVDQPSVLQMNHSTAGEVINNLPFTKVLMLPMPSLASGDWETLVLNGATAGIAPMQQAVMMNYTVVACTGLVT
jgi:hypothetical protein